MRGFDDNYFAPHSRYTEVRLEDIKKHPDLIPLAVSDLAGLHIVANQSGRQIFVTGHAEYDRDTLAKEYFRDINKGLNPKVPLPLLPPMTTTPRPRPSPGAPTPICWCPTG